MHLQNNTQSGEKKLQHQETIVTQEPILIDDPELVSLNPEKRKGSFEYTIFGEKIIRKNP